MQGYPIRLHPEGCSIPHSQIWITKMVVLSYMVELERNMHPQGRCILVVGLDGWLAK